MLRHPYQALQRLDESLRFNNFEGRTHLDIVIAFRYRGRNTIDLTGSSLRMSNESYEDHLQQIWQQGHRNMAVNFLKRAVSMESTLAEVAAALQFEAVRGFVDGIRLRDVLLQAVAPKSATITTHKVAAARPKKRKRRGPAEMKEIKAQLLAMLRAEPGSLDSTQLYESLANMGHQLDRITLNRLLTQLQEEQHITCMGGRPKAWRAVAQRQQSLLRESASVSL